MSKIVNKKVVKAISLGLSAFMAMGNLPGNAMIVFAESDDNNTSNIEETKDAASELQKTEVAEEKEVTVAAIEEKYDAVETAIEQALNGTAADEAQQKEATAGLNQAETAVENTNLADVKTTLENETISYDDVKEDLVDSEEEIETSKEAAVETKVETVEYFVGAAEQNEKDADAFVEKAQEAIANAMEEVQNIHGEDGYAAQAAEAVTEAKEAAAAAEKATTVAEANAAVEKAEAAVEKAQDAYDNADAAVVEAQNQLDAAETAMKAAKEKLDAAKANVEASQEEIKEAQAEADAAYAKAQELEKRVKELVAEKENAQQYKDLTAISLARAEMLKYNVTKGYNGVDNVKYGDESAETKYWTASRNYNNLILLYHYMYEIEGNKEVSLKWITTKPGPNGNYLELSYTDKDDVAHTVYYNYHSDKEGEITIYDITKVDAANKLENSKVAEDAHYTVGDNTYSVAEVETAENIKKVEETYYQIGNASTADYIASNVTAGTVTDETTLETVTTEIDGNKVTVTYKDAAGKTTKVEETVYTEGSAVTYDLVGGKLVAKKAGSKVTTTTTYTYSEETHDAVSSTYNYNSAAAAKAAGEALAPEGVAVTTDSQTTINSTEDSYWGVLNVGDVFYRGNKLVGVVSVDGRGKEHCPGYYYAQDYTDVHITELKRFGYQDPIPAGEYGKEHQMEREYQKAVAYAEKNKPSKDSIAFIRLEVVQQGYNYGHGEGTKHAYVVYYASETTKYNYTIDSYTTPKTETSTVTGEATGIDYSVTTYDSTEALTYNAAKYWREDKTDLKTNYEKEYQAKKDEIDQLKADAEAATKAVKEAKDNVDALAEALEKLTVDTKEYDATVEAYEAAKNNLVIAKADLAEISANLDAAKDALEDTKKALEDLENAQNAQSDNAPAVVIIEDVPVALAADVLGADREIEPVAGDVLGADRAPAGDVLGAGRPQTGDYTTAWGAALGAISSGMMLAGYAAKRKKEEEE